MLKLVAASSVVLGAGLLLHATPPLKSPVLLVSAKSTSGSTPSSSSSGSCYYPCIGRPAFAEELKSSSYPRLSTSATARSAADVQVEPSTGIEFSMLEKFPGAPCEFSLLGLGVREKKIAFVAVKVYAVGFYASVKQLSSKNSLVEGAFEKGLVIKLARDVSGAQFSSALDDELKPRLKSSPDGERILAEFGKLFNTRSLKKGTGIYFTWIQPDTLYVAISDDGVAPANPTSTFVSKIFASSLFDVYLGDKPVSPSLKASLAHNHRV